MKRVLAVLVMSTLIFAVQSVSQEKTFEEKVKSLSMAAAKGYVDPIVSGIGSDMNGGWFHRAPAGKIFGLDLELGVVAMGTYFKDENKSFDITGEFQFSTGEARDFVKSAYPGLPDPAVDILAQQLAAETFMLRIYGPTVVGSKDEHVHIELPARSYSVPGYPTPFTFSGDQVLPGITGQDLQAKAAFLPLIAPQVTIGTLLGTQATFRYFPKIKLGDIGDAKYFGYGIQHNPDVWLGGLLPVDLALAFYTQTLEVGDGPLFKAKTTAYGINASKQLGLGFLNVTPYAGFMLESSKLSFQYEFNTVVAGQPVDQPVAFDLEGSNKSRIVLGLSIRLLIINVNADYNIGTYNSFTAGVMLAI